MKVKSKMADKRFIHQNNIDNAIKMLDATIRTLNKYDIKYYLDFGTLLGAVRDNGFIPWDDDMDITILNSKDFSKIPQILQEIKKEYNYRTYLITFKQSMDNRLKANKIIYHDKISFANDDDYQIAKLRSNKFWKFGRGKTRLDIFFKYEEDGYVYWFADGMVNKVAKKYHVKELKEISFYNLKCYIPENYDEYLTHVYGDWKTPNKEWTESDGVSISE